MKVLTNSDVSYVAALIEPALAATLLSAGASGATRLVALATGDVPSDTRARYLKGAGFEPVMAVAGSTDVAWLTDLASRLPNLPLGQRRGLARNTKTPSPALAQLCTDENATVAAYALMNPSAPLAAVSAALPTLGKTGRFNLDADRAVFAGSILRAHPSLVNFFASHADSTFRRLAARAPLTQDDVDGLYPPDPKALHGVAGRESFLTNPFVSATRMPNWYYEDSPIREHARACLDASGTLRPSASVYDAARLGSPVVDAALAERFRTGYFGADSADRVLTTWSARTHARDPEPDALADVLTLASVDALALSAKSFSSSRLSGVCRRSLRMAAAEHYMESASFLSSYSAYHPDRVSAFANVVEAAHLAVDELGTSVEAWRLLLLQAPVWKSSPEDLVLSAQDMLSLEQGPVRTLTLPAASRPLSSPSLRR